MKVSTILSFRYLSIRPCHLDFPLLCHQMTLLCWPHRQRGPQICHHIALLGVQALDDRFNMYPLRRGTCSLTNRSHQAILTGSPLCILPKCLCGEYRYFEPQIYLYPRTTSHHRATTFHRNCRAHTQSAISILIPYTVIRTTRHQVLLGGVCPEAVHPSHGAALSRRSHR